MIRKTPTRGASRTRCALCHASPSEPKQRKNQPPGRSLNNAATASRVGTAFEVHARAFLERQQLHFIARNVTTRGGEIDLVMRDSDGTLVFVEVRARTHGRYGNAATSIDQHKRQRIVLAAQQFWAAQGGDCACRFDVVAFDGGQLTWLRDAFQTDNA